MYSVYAQNYIDGEAREKYLLYVPTMLQYGYNIFSPKLVTEIGKAGSFSFSVPSNHPNYTSLHKLAVVVSVYDGDELLWRGRVLDSRKDFYNNKSITCEGELAYLNDIPIKDFDYSENGITPQDLFEYILREYSRSCSDYRKLNIGNFHYTPDVRNSKDESYDETLYDGPKMIYPKSEEWTDTLSVLNEHLIDRIGGFIKIRYENDKPYVDYYSQSYLDDFQNKIDNSDETAIANRSSQVIEFGKNLIDLEEYIDATEVYTCVIPLGAKKEAKHSWDTSYKGRYDISSLNLRAEVDGDTISTNAGDYHIQSENGIKLFGKIMKVIVYDEIDNSTDYNGTTVRDSVVAKRLFSKAYKSLRNAIKMAVNISISAVDLHLLDINTEGIRVGQYVRVLSLPHGIDSYYMFSKLELDLASPDNSHYTLGIDTLSLTDKQVGSIKKMNTAYSNTISALSDMAQ